MSERNGEETFIVPEVLRLMSVKQQNADPFLGTVLASASGTVFRAPGAYRFSIKT